LQEDARFFQEYHYLNPFDIDDSEQVAPWVQYIYLLYSWEFFPWVVTQGNLNTQSVVYFFLAFAVFWTCKLRYEELVFIILVM
jgi:hypothetical protein